MILEVDIYVNRKDTKNPTGIVESLDHENATATVRWGVADGRTYREVIPQAELEVVTEKIVSTEEVQKRHAKESAASYHEIED